MLSTISIPAGSVLAAAWAVDAGQSSAVSVALIGAVGGLGIAVVTGVFALLKDRQPKQIDPGRHLPETADALATEMGRVDELLAEVRSLRAEVDVWQDRAYAAGWRA